MGRACAVPKCKTGYKSVKVKCSVFTAPKNIEQLKKWQAAIPGGNFKSSQSICEKHFEEKCILREWVKCDSGGQIIAKVPYLHPRLVDGAIPSIFETPTTSMPMIIGEPTQSPVEGPNFLKHQCMSTETSHMGPDTECGQATCAVPQDTIMNQDVLPHDIVDTQPAVSNSTPESLHHEVHPVTQLTSAASLVQNQKVANCVSTEPIKNFLISKVTIIDLTSSVATSEGNLITLPTSWGVTEYAEQRGQRVVFSNILRSYANGTACTFIDKSVEVESDRTVRCYVYGRLIDPDRCQLPPVLTDTTVLPEALETFKKLNVCQGLGPVNTYHLPIDCVFQDSVQRWRDNACTMISKEKRCDNCKKMRQRTLRRESRSEKTENIHRIRHLSNPIDRRKVMALQMKMSREKRVTNSLKRRVHSLTQSLKGKAEETAYINVEALDENFSRLQVPI